MTSEPGRPAGAAIVMLALGAATSSVAPPPKAFTSASGLASSARSAAVRTRSLEIVYVPGSSPLNRATPDASVVAVCVLAAEPERWTVT